MPPIPKTGDLDFEILTNHKSATAETNDPQIYLNLLWSTLSLLSTIKNLLFLWFLCTLLLKNLLRLCCKLYFRICKCIGYGLTSIKSATKVGFKHKRLVFKTKNLYMYMYIYICVYIIYDSTVCICVCKLH